MNFGILMINTIFYLNKIFKI